MTDTRERTLHEQLLDFVGQPTWPPRRSEQPVNEAMIHHWCLALGDTNPVYTDPDAAASSVHGGIVAPPTMLQAWAMPPIYVDRSRRSGASADMGRLLSAHGYTGIVATNSEQTYHRYLRPGDRLTEHNVIEDVSPEKQTALGTGFFVTTKATYVTDDGEVVGEMLFRLFRFKPRPRPSGERPKPAVSEDTAFFWEGAERGELRIQRCASCGTLRHPPRPMCPECRSLEWDWVVSSGRGTVHSFVVHHHPPIPGFDLPFTVVLVDLEEGTRLVADFEGGEAEVGLPVEVTFPGGLPRFRPREDG